MTDISQKKPDFNYSLKFEPDSSDDEGDFKLPAGLAQKLDRIKTGGLDYSLNFEEDEDDDVILLKKPVTYSAEITLKYEHTAIYSRHYA